MSLEFCIIIESNSQKTFFAIVLYTNMAAVTSGANQELLGWLSNSEKLIAAPSCTRNYLDNKGINDYYIQKQHVNITLRAFKY